MTHGEVLRTRLKDILVLANPKNRPIKSISVSWKDLQQTDEPEIKIEFDSPIYIYHDDD